MISLCMLVCFGWTWTETSCVLCVGMGETGDKTWGIPPFFIEHGPHPNPKGPPFAFQAPTTASNALRVLRALQLKKAVLLEGSPGVGKTSLVSALATATGELYCIIHHTGDLWPPTSHATWLSQYCFLVKMHCHGHKLVAVYVAVCASTHLLRGFAIQRCCEAVHRNGCIYTAWLADTPEVHARTTAMMMQSYLSSNTEYFLMTSKYAELFDITLPSLQPHFLHGTTTTDTVTRPFQETVRSAAKADVL